MEHLGDVVMVWAHPDDETYLAGGLSATLTALGQRVVWVTATRGEAGGDPALRSAELEAAARLARLLDDVGPDTVITFGPDGFTGHPDHRAVNGWTDAAVARTGRRPWLLHPVARPVPLDADLNDNFNVFEHGRPRICADDELAVLLELGGDLLDLKVEALRAQDSQTRALVEAVGIARYRAWVAQEAFAEPLATGLPGP